FNELNPHKTFAESEVEPSSFAQKQGQICTPAVSWTVICANTTANTKGHPILSQPDKRTRARPRLSSKLVPVYAKASRILKQVLMLKKKPKAQTTRMSIQKQVPHQLLTGQLAKVYNVLQAHIGNAFGTKRSAKKAAPQLGLQ